MTEYDRGFSDGLQCVADILRRSAHVVEQTEYGGFTKPNGQAVKAISRTGQVHFAKKLRDVAQIIEQMIEEARQ